MKLSKEKLQEILECHGKWLRGEDGGQRADLQGADLRGADLQDTDLRVAGPDELPTMVREKVCMIIESGMK